MSTYETLHLKTSFADAVVKVECATEALLAHAIKVSPCSSVGSLFAKVRQLNKQYAKNPDGYDQMKFFASIEALWIADALEMAIGDPKARDSIRRIVGNEMDLSGRESSQGKDALWELDVYRRLKLGGAVARFAEPDVVVPLGDGLGDYGVACKKVYADSGVPGALEYGCNQLKKAGLPGVVAFNLDDLMEEKAVLHVLSMDDLHAEAKRWAKGFVSRHGKVFQRAIERGRCDGVILSITIVYEIPNGAPPINLARIPINFDYQPGLGEPANARLTAFLRSMDQVTKRQ